MQFIIIFITSIHLVYGKLKIIQPLNLLDQFSSTNGEIKYSVSNFGNIPWGRKIKGYLDQANPLEACSQIQSIVNAQFVLIKRGNCTFVTKVRNAQNAGYQFAIIEDDRNEIIDNITLSDDGTGYSIQIPSVFISKSDGDKLSKYFNTDEESEQIPIQLLMKFDVRQKEIVDVIFAFSMTSGETYKFLREYYPYYKDLEEQKVNYTLLYPLYSILLNPTRQIEFSNCISSGRYCAPDPDGVGIGNGQMVVRETLRQLCIFYLSESHWFEYMVNIKSHLQQSFKDNCTSAQMFSDCSTKVQAEVGIDTQKVEKCIRNQEYETNTTVNNATIKFQMHAILEHQLFLWDAAGVQSLPGIIINHQDYLGKITASGVFVDICNSFLTTPEVCGNYVDGYVFQSTDSSTNIFLTVTIIVGVMIVFFIIVFYIYTKLVRKEFQESSQSQVNEMVTHYIQFYESKDKKNKEAI